MLNTGIFPDSLKISKVLPLFKKDNDKLFSNYRPISLLPSISKIFEKVIFNQMSEYFESNDLIFKNQYGFRKNHSTEFASLHLTDYFFNFFLQGRIFIKKIQQKTIYIYIYIIL